MYSQREGEGGVDDEWIISIQIEIMLMINLIDLSNVHNFIQVKKAKKINPYYLYFGNDLLMFKWMFILEFKKNILTKNFKIFLKIN